MDLDPLKRRIITRGIGALDMFLGICVLVVNLHTMWNVYLFEVKKRPLEINNVFYNVTNSEELDKVSEQLLRLKLPFFSFVLLCILVFGVNLFEIFMGFALQVATFGRNQEDSIRISLCWLRVSLSLLFLAILKVLLVGVGIAVGELAGEWLTLSLGLVEVIFRIFASCWVPRFIIYLRWQADFDSRCPVMRY